MKERGASQDGQRNNKVREDSSSKMNQTFSYAPSKEGYQSTNPSKFENSRNSTQKNSSAYFKQ